VETAVSRDKKTNPAILVAEDDAILNRLIGKTLARAGLRVECVSTGREALSRCAANGVSLLLLDYQLPDMHGGEVIESLRAADNDIPFVMMTGHGDQRIAVDMMKLGARDYLVKERDFIERLPQTVTRVLNQLEVERKLSEAQRDNKTLEEQLRQAQKMEAVGALAGGVAHDFNNILTAILGYTMLAIEDAPSGSEQYDQLHQVQRAAERAAGLTRQLLLFSRKETPRFAVVDVHETLEDILKMLRRLIGEDIRVVTAFAEEPCSVEADVGNIEQMVMNLALNARDAMPTGGDLTIETSLATLSAEDCATIPNAKPGKYVCLSVTDTGTGMDADTQKRVFEPFFTTKEAGKGTGLGCAVVYGIVAQHKGWINVYSEPGHGSTFKVFLPACAPQSKKTEQAAPRIGALQGNGERVLVAEDNESIREWCGIALRENGYAVVETSNASEALDAIERDGARIDLIISDVIMPGMSGFQLVERAQKCLPDVAIILSSGYPSERAGWERVHEKGYRFLQKPYTMGQLIEAAHQALHGEVIVKVRIPLNPPQGDFE
jgi:two-component system cell cycle sensor histidine kinase/response regulator CckA